MERVWQMLEMFRKASRHSMTHRNAERGRGCCGLSQDRKLNPKLNTDIVIICPRNRKVLVTRKKPIFPCLPVP